MLSTLVRDFEMSQADAVESNPWQTDACIGGWHYSRSIYENHRYRTPESMVHLLVDVVSKNGNLLLNIPLPGHGRPDDDEFAFLDKFGAWMALNSEAIYSTRPWKIYGEGPTKGGGSLYGGRGPQFVAGDIRFTTKGDSLYAIALAWPEDRKLVIRSLASDSPHYRGEIARDRTAGVGVQSHVVAQRGRSHGQPAGKAAVRLRVRIQDQPPGSVTGLWFAQIRTPRESGG